MCLTKGDNYIEIFKTNKTQYLVRGAIRGTPEGFSTVSFENEKNESNSFIFWDKKKGITESNDFEKIQFSKIEPFREYYFNRGYWNLLFFDFKVNASVYNSSILLKVYSNENEFLFQNQTNQTGNWVMRPQKVVSIPLSDAKKCQVFLCNMKFSQLHFGYMLADQIIVSVLICLSFLGINHQPLKSRGFILIFGLIIQFFEGFSNLIPYLISVSNSYKYEYILQDVIFVTLRFSSYLLIIAVFFYNLNVEYVENFHGFVHSKKLSIHLFKYFDFFKFYFHHHFFQILHVRFWSIEYIFIIILLTSIYIVYIHFIYFTFVRNSIYDDPTFIFIFSIQIDSF
jgi:hypothetical protein